MQVLVCVMLYLAQPYDLRGALVSWNTCKIAAAVAGMTDARVWRSTTPCRGAQVSWACLGFETAFVHVLVWVLL